MSETTVLPDTFQAAKGKRLFETYLAFRARRIQEGQWGGVALTEGQKKRLEDIDINLLRWGVILK